MNGPLEALPRPRLDPDVLSASWRRLRALSASIDAETARWHPRAEGWHGRSSQLQADQISNVRIQAAALPPDLVRAAASIDRLVRNVRTTGEEIDSLATLVRAARSRASDLAAAAERAARHASIASTAAGPIGVAEAERLRQRAVQARRRADEASREADFTLRRAIETASELVNQVDRQDMVVASDIDTLLLSSRPEGRFSHDPWTWSAPPTEREWLSHRIAATRSSIHRHVEALTEAIEHLESVPWAEMTWWDSVALEHLTEERALHRRFLAPGRQLLGWDPRDDGRVVEVFGDLATARHIAVVVPGIMNTIRNFDEQASSNADHLWDAATDIDSDTAVIAWLGYDTPELLNAVSKDRAVEYESELRGFVSSLPTDAHVTVVAHSYGTVLTAEAAARGLAADDVVFVGSPGTRLDHASDADLEPGAQIFAGVSETDYLVGRSGYGSVVCPEKAAGLGWLTPVRWLVSPVTGPFSWFTDSCKTDADGDVKGLSHGMNPAHEDFGAIEIDTDGVGGHSSYFGEGSTSLDAIAQIVSGTHPDQD